MTSELAIWWLDEEAISLVVALEPKLPDYLWGELHSMHGRPKRGRLWSAKRFGIVNLNWPDSELVRLLEESFGGIIVANEDVAALAFLPGFVTDFKLTRVTRATSPAVKALVEACRDLRAFRNGADGASIGSSTLLGPLWLTLEAVEREIGGE